MEPPPLPTGHADLRSFGLALAVCFGPLVVFAILAEVSEALGANGMMTVVFAFLGFSLLADGILFFVALARAFNGTPGGWGLLAGTALFWVIAVVYILKQMSIL